MFGRPRFWPTVPVIAPRQNCRLCSLQVARLQRARIDGPDGSGATIRETTILASVTVPVWLIYGEIVAAPPAPAVDGRDGRRREVDKAMKK